MTSEGDDMDAHDTAPVRGGPRRAARGRGGRTASDPRTAPARRLGPSGVRRTAAVLALLLLGPAALGRTALPTPLAPAASDATDAVDLAVAVDESSSLSAADVERERDAAGRIAVGEISPASRMTVLGFASADNDDQSPVDEVCPTTALDAVAREKMDDCLRRLARRGPGRGTGTDFPNAIRQGVTRLSEHGGSRPRILFLLTDGKLDVSGSPSYGTDVDSREENGRRELTKALAEARAAKVQIWPLGFGDDLDMDALRDMAEGGYRGGCTDLEAARPRADRATDSQTLGDAVQRAFAGARCLVTDPPRKDTPPADISVPLSPLATLATIVVSKGDRAVRATYYDPRGRKIEPGSRSDGSTFTLAGSGGEVESLRITDPRPGRWQVRLDAPEGHRERLASVSVQWRGAVRSSIVLTPAAPRPGEKARVELTLQTRDEQGIGDPADLRRLKVSGRLTGDGFAPLDLALADDGERGDKEDDDGRFTGTVTIPRQATGAVKAVGVLGAVGLTADHRPFLTRIASPNPEVRAGLRVGDAEVHPGGSVPFRLLASNDSDRPHTLRLTLRDTQPGAVALSLTEVTLAPGDSVDRAGRLTVGGELSPRALTARMEVSDADDAARPLDAKLVQVDVTPVPSWPHRVWDAWWWALVTGAVLLAALLGGFVWHRRQVREDVSPGGLLLRLSVSDDSGEWTTSETAVPRKRDPWYRFDVSDPDGPSPRLDPRPTGRYAVQRDPSTGFRLRAPDGRDQSYPLGRDVPLEGRVRLRAERGTGGRPAARRPGRPRWLADLLPRQRTPVTAPSDRRDAYDPGGRDTYGGSSYGGSSYDEFDEAT
ncbi:MULTISPECIES: vWA domain-containing protein [Streptomyces]|uniref:VWA domain-containing protein n=2 Tax=Streptomyces TaxID=1883 RepID=A0A2U9PA70_STRAS|nr:vWA domain-containing protein [Streptomyces actuosus]AWT45991.1 VWA domain-containing protein [Streptomyces actuosus]MBM4822645.1 VWA domain-containing protein [Streptomyces actuosus]